jgi:hypothetical protein
MTAQIQSFKNHTRWFPPFHFFVIPVLLLNVLVAVRGVFVAPDLGSGFGLILALALFMLAASVRAMAMTVQDRVIRLEMRLRLRECLPVDLHPRISNLTPRQLVALRFAGDSEMADLVREVLAGSLATEKAIKMRIKNWQGDFLRA